MSSELYFLIFTGVVGLGVSLGLRYPKVRRGIGIIAVILCASVFFTLLIELQNFPKHPDHVVLKEAVPSNNSWVIIDDIKWNCNYIFYLETGPTINTNILFSNTEKSREGLAIFNKKLSCDEITSMEISGTLEYIDSRQLSFLKENGIDARENYLSFCTYCGKNNTFIGVIASGLLFLCGLMLLILNPGAKKTRLTKRAPDGATPQDSQCGLPSLAR